MLLDHSTNGEAMKRSFSLVWVTLFFAAAPLFAQPKLEVVGGTTLDLGDAFAGQKLDHIITVKNIGKDTLHISDVKAQCGCTAAMMSDQDKNLAPKAVGKLSISFDTRNYGGSKVSKQVYISSDDTSNPRMTVTFTANVVNILDMDPKILSFDNMKLDTSYTRTITITNPSAKNRLKILSVDPKFPMIKVTLMKNELMPGEKTQLQAVFTPTKTGTFQGLIELTTDHTVQPKFNISYYAWVNKK
jgi:hypothetical protein